MVITIPCQLHQDFIAHGPNTKNPWWSPGWQNIPKLKPGEEFEFHLMGIGGLDVWRKVKAIVVEVRTVEGFESDGFFKLSGWWIIRYEGNWIEEPFKRNPKVQHSLRTGGGRPDLQYIDALNLYVSKPWYMRLFTRRPRRKDFKFTWRSK